MVLRRPIECTPYYGKFDAKFLGTRGQHGGGSMLPASSWT
jgi:hypothetical protein